MANAIERDRTQILDGHRDRHARRRQIAAGDSSDQKGKMAAGYNNLIRKKKSSSAKWDERKRAPAQIGLNWQHFLLALRDPPIEEPLLYLCDNQSLLKAVNRKIGEGGKVMLVGAPDVDILAAAIEILRKRIAAETATFLVKVKAHIYQDRHSKFNNSVRDAVRRGTTENELQKHEKRLTGAWRQMNTLRRRYKIWCKGDGIEHCTHKQRYEPSYQSMVKPP